MTKSRNQMVATTFGGVYVLIGLVGFAVTAGLGFAATQGKDLILFELNPLHNVVHLSIGALFLVGASMGERASRGVNLAVGGTYLVVGLIGFFLTSSSANILALNHPDNLLHIASAAVALIVASRPLASSAPASVRSSRAA